MEIILSKQCEALTGSLGKGFGYYIRRATDENGSVHFFSQRSKWDVPADGHLRFIFACAELAQMKTHIADIRVPRKELSDAIREAGFVSLADYLDAKGKSYHGNLHADPDTMHADDIINFYNYWFK